MSDATQATVPDGLETVLDGSFLNLKFASEDGTCWESRRLKVRKIPIREMEELSRVWGKIDRELCLYLNLKSAEVDRLHEDSFAAALEEGRRLNFTLFGKWWKWRAQAVEAMGQNEAINEVIKAAVAKVESDLASVK